MAGNTRFNIAVKITNGDALPELQGRVNDMSPAFEAIVKEWVKLNQQKFNKSKGMEGSGAAVDDLVYWEPLKEATSRAKRRKGQPDQIMVATGSLQSALTNPDLIFEQVSAQDVMFGTPLDPYDAAKVGYQWSRRQAIFLSTIDQNMIRRIVKDYLSNGPGFEQKRFAAGLAAVGRANEEAQMDMDFSNDINEDAGTF